MSNVTDLQEYKQAQEPHVAGPAICDVCKHEWHFVCPVPIPEQFDCPSCGELAGRPTAEVNLPEGTRQLFCECGNWRFAIASKPEGIFATCCVCAESVSIEDD